MYAWRGANLEKNRQIVNDWRRRNKHVKLRLELARTKKFPHIANARNAKRRAAKRRACVAWADPSRIRETYDLAQLRTRLTGIVHHVDHIVPLASPIVCGLHVEHNLQVIPAAANHAKNNRTWPGMP